MDYLGDTWLKLEDNFEYFDHPLPCMEKALALGLPINLKYASYFNGQKTLTIKQLCFEHGVNRVYNTDPEKYAKIWAGKDERYQQKRKIPLEMTTPQQRHKRALEQMEGIDENDQKKADSYIN